MSGESFDLEAWYQRIGYNGTQEPTLATLRGIVAAQSGAIPFENVDVLLGRVPELDITSLQRKLIQSARGGYCFELNGLLRAGLRAMGFAVTGLMARVIRGMDANASGPATHMMLRVDLPEGAFLADAGFGNQTPTAPLALRPDIEQVTPHGVVRLTAVGEELTLQSRTVDGWENIYRLSPRPALDIDYEVGNWFTATHPNSPFVGNLIVARPAAGGVRYTLLNGRLSTRRLPGQVEREMLADAAAIRTVIATRFGLTVPADDLAKVLAILDQKGTRGAEHPSFT